MLIARTMLNVIEEDFAESCAIFIFTLKKNFSKILIMNMHILNGDFN